MPFQLQDVRRHAMAALLTLLAGVATPSRGATVVVQEVNYKFSPASSTVNAGDTILWTNLDNDFHTSTSGASGNADGLWSSGTMPPDATFSFTFNLAPGNYPYFCVFHYTIGMVGNVTVQAAHVPPTVSITSPTNGATFSSGSDIVIQSSASASNGGTLTQVSFFENGSLIGSATSAPYTATFTTPPAGPYALTAVATDDQGASSTSAVVNVTVEGAILQPTVAITNPVNGEAFRKGTNILIQATASENGGSISQVQFFVNSNLFATLTNPPYDFLLTNVAPGNYVLMATAMDSLGVTSASPAITITVATNLPPTVAITQPTNAARFPSSGAFSVVASATAQQGGIAQVNFFLGTNSAGVVLALPFEITLSNLPPGIYPLRATAQDTTGLVGTSSVVSITVIGAPLCALTAPTNNAVFPVGSSVTNKAVVTTNGVAVTNVEFFANSDLVGQVAAAPYAVTWMPSQAGVFELTAVAFDAFGQAGTSAPVSVRAFVPESGHPTIRITKAPRNSSSLKSGQVAIAGTAQDAVGLDQVQFQVNGGPFQTAVGTNFWQAAVVLFPGKNAIGFQSVNLAGNTSVEVFRYYTYIVDVPLTVNIAGPGSVVPDLNGKLLQIGKVYQITAHPDADALFTGWTNGAATNGVASTKPTLSFQMASNLILTANFVTNLFPAVAGAYTGLIFDTNAVFPASSASFTLQVGSLGVFSGKLAMNGAIYPFHDQFNASGVVTVPVLRPNLVPVALSLQLDLTNASNLITGTATGDTWTSALLGYRNIFASLNPAARAGSLPFVLASTAGGPAAGQATASVSRTGAAVVRGRLADGRPFTSATTLTPDDSFPFYTSLAGGTEVLIGWLNLSGSPAAGISGTVFWTKEGTNGFSTTLLVAPP